MTFKKFHPPHIFLDSTIYFITSRTRDKVRFFNTQDKKKILKESLAQFIKSNNIKLYAWVILDNHYHLLLYVKSKQQLIKFIKSSHGKSAIKLNKSEHKLGRKIWVNYWDRCIRDEKDFYTHLNYIHHNPVKHGYVKEMSKYEFSSYNDFLVKYGEEWLSSSFNLYPLIDLTPQDI